MPWSWSSSSAHDPQQRNYTCYQTTHNLSIRTYNYWHRLSERRLSSEYSVLILFRIRILYQSLRKLCRSEIFSLFLNLFVSYALLLQETSWMDSRPHRPPASITRCLLQKLWYFTRWWAPGLGARERSIAQGRIRRNLLCSRQSALAVRSTPACSVLSSGRSLWATLKLVLPWKRTKLQSVKLKARVKNNEKCAPHPHLCFWWGAVHVLAKVQRMVWIY